MTEANRRPRCTEPSCAVRYRGGPDRACPLHVDEMAELAARMDAAADGLMAAQASAMADGWWTRMVRVRRAAIPVPRDHPAR